MSWEGDWTSAEALRGRRPIAVLNQLRAALAERAAVVPSPPTLPPVLEEGQLLRRRLTSPVTWLRTFELAIGNLISKYANYTLDYDTWADASKSWMNKQWNTTTIEAETGYNASTWNSANFWTPVFNAEKAFVLYKVLNAFRVPEMPAILMKTYLPTRHINDGGVYPTYAVFNVRTGARDTAGVSERTLESFRVDTTCGFSLSAAWNKTLETMDTATYLDYVYLEYANEGSNVKQRAITQRRQTSGSARESLNPSRWETTSNWNESYGYKFFEFNNISQPPSDYSRSIIYDVWLDNVRSISRCCWGAPYVDETQTIQEKQQSLIFDYDSIDANDTILNSVAGGYHSDKASIPRDRPVPVFGVDKWGWEGYAISSDDYTNMAIFANYSKPEAWCQFDYRDW